MILTEIRELTVCGIRSWHWHCRNCGQSGMGHTTEAAAVRDARQHGAQCARAALIMAGR